ncbi:uncharacterized protein LOC134813369 isoform X5 [Bolinopsis microptera]|uniref:uncharacterized protein LOC134813369 isoform X5 n=1 Tax=Bolinopsis microptera TaxID=2820187 RepID=UPI003079BE2A
MASASTAPLPIFYNNDVHNFYLKQKQEFHFTQKSDNEFLMFLLDTAVRVISIVQHLAPVIEAVSDAGIEVDDIEDDVSPIHTPNNTSNISAGAMDVDSVDPTPSALSAELEQINQEITNAQISSQQLSRQPSVFTRRPLPLPAPAPISIPVSVPVSASTSSESELIMLPIAQSTAMLSVSQPTAMLSLAQPSAVHTPSANRSDSNRSDSLAPNVPLIQLPSSAQSSENTTTSLPSASQPVAEPPDDSLANVKTEQPVPEVIEIKEEVNDLTGPASESSELISQDTLDQLMSSISGAEDNVGLQNFVPTATPSGLPPSFLDRGAGNPLSMLGSLNSGDGPGPSGINVPNISESMMKNISDAGLNVSSIKGQANPISVKPPVWGYCPFCNKSTYSSLEMGRHLDTAHGSRLPDTALPGTQQSENTPYSHLIGNRFTDSRDHGAGAARFECPRCKKCFSRKWTLHRHMLTTEGKCYKIFTAYENI